MAANFFLLVPSGAATTVQGAGTVFGTIGGTQDVTVRDAPGTITFDGSFNTGGDRIRLEGNAGGYTVRRSGASVTISDGDTHVVVPVGTGGADIVFADGVRSLSVDMIAGVVRLGAQVIDSTAMPISAAAGVALATGAASESTASQMVMTGGATATAYGRSSVFGTTAGSETVVVAAGAQVTFDGSYNAGTDIISLPGVASAWTAARSGATALLLGPGGESVAIPVGPNATVLRFADSDRTLAIDEVAGAVRLGGIALGADPAPVGSPERVTGNPIADAIPGFAHGLIHDMPATAPDFATFIV